MFGFGNTDGDGGAAPGGGNAFGTGAATFGGGDGATFGGGNTATPTPNGGFRFGGAAPPPTGFNLGATPTGIGPLNEYESAGTNFHLAPSTIEVREPIPPSSSFYYECQSNCGTMRW